MIFILLFDIIHKRQYETWWKCIFNIIIRQNIYNL